MLRRKVIWEGDPGGYALDVTSYLQHARVRLVLLPGQDLRHTQWLEQLKRT